MDTDLRLEKMEKTVRRLVLMNVAVVFLGVGAFLMGAGKTMDAAGEPWSGPQPVAAPADGFVVVPQFNGNYKILKKDQAPEAILTSWK